jgi:hypothetical protein
MERSHSEDPGVGGTIILRLIFRKWDVRACTESIWFRKETGNEPSRSIKCGEFLDKLKTE